MNLFLLITALFYLSPILILILIFIGYKAYASGRNVRLFVILSVTILYIALLYFSWSFILKPAVESFFSPTPPLKMENVAERIDDLALTKEALGTSFSLGEPLNLYATPRSPNGDGFTLLIYPLSEEMFAQLQSPSTDFFEHPKQEGDRHDWERQPWKKRKVTDDLTEILDFALVFAPTEFQTKVRTSLEHPTTYYAYLVYKITVPGLDEPRIGNIDLYILDFEEKLFYVINHNT